MPRGKLIFGRVNWHRFQLIRRSQRPSGVCSRAPKPPAALLAESIPSVVVQSVDPGHIGVIVGSRADKEVYDPVADWIKNVAMR